MGIGYILGCFMSILLWKVDREYIFQKIYNNIHKIIKSSMLMDLLYIVFIVGLCFLLQSMARGQWYDGITAFIVLDISNVERESMMQRDKILFYSSISRISKALVCNFVAPLFYILILGNWFAILYVLLTHCAFIIKRKWCIFICDILTIIPALLVEIPLYFIYVCKNRELKIDFKGDFFINSVTRPLLNVDILAAYIEAVNFYYHFNGNSTLYFKSYGEYHKKIDSVCIKDYLGVSYTISLLAFSLFFIFKFIF